MSTKKSTALAVVDGQEFDALEKEAAQAEADESVYSYTHTLKKPFTYEGKTYTELAFDFGKLTGADALAIQDEMDSLGKPLLVKQVNDHYLLRVVARACTIPIAVNVLTALPLPDFNRITGKARSFLLSSGL